MTNHEAALRAIHHSLMQAEAYHADMDGTPPTYSDSRAPDGDDYNEIMAWVDHAFAVAEDGLRAPDPAAQAASAMLAALVEIEASLTNFPKRMLTGDMVILTRAAIVLAEQAGIKVEG